MNKTHIRAYSKVMSEVAALSGNALELELSVGLAVLYETAPSKRLGRETLVTIYHNAGYQCDNPGALDWRRVNRRITASIALFDFIGMEQITAMADGHKAADLVEAFRPVVRDLKVKSVNEVLLACEKIRPPRKPTAQPEGQRVDVGHLHLIIPHNATKDELIAMATKLMQMAMSADDVHAEVPDEAVTA
jgi:hypothetical protein